MKIQYCSDLHLEFSQNRNFLESNPLTSKGDILLLAGDIVLFSKLEEHMDYFNYLSDNFKITYWVPGNHEYYHSDVINRTGSFSEKIKDNVILINNMSVIQDNIKFIFSTLWTDIKPSEQWFVERGMNDFHVIKNNGHRFSITKQNQLHEHCMIFLKSELNGKGKKVVVTHHVPTFMNYPKEYAGNVLQNAFAVELFDFIEPSNINYWIYAHNHHNTPEFKIGKTKIITNQLGYVDYGEHKTFDQNKIITL